MHRICPASRRCGLGVRPVWAGHAGAGRVTGRSGMGGSGWATAARYDTDSGMKFFVKQVPRDAGSVIELT